MAINRIRADIDLDAILYNMESMHNKLKPGTMMAAVVKADGYGHGAVITVKAPMRIFSAEWRKRIWSRLPVTGRTPIATRHGS